MRSESAAVMSGMFSFIVIGFTAGLLAPAGAWGQGETTSAIVGQVTDSTKAVVSGATVTVTNRDTGLKRSGRTDDAGRFNFPQLQPGAYTVRAEAQGFEPQQVENVLSGLGQKQTVNLVLRVALVKPSKSALKLPSSIPRTLTRPQH